MYYTFIRMNEGAYLRHIILNTKVPSYVRRYEGIHMYVPATARARRNGRHNWHKTKGCIDALGFASLFLQEIRSQCDDQIASVAMDTSYIQELERLVVAQVSLEPLVRLETFVPHLTFRGFRYAATLTRLVLPQWMH